MIFKVQKVDTLVSDGYHPYRSTFKHTVTLYCHEHDTILGIVFYGENNQELKKYSDALELSTDIIVNISTDNTEKQRTINMLKAK